MSGRPAEAREAIERTGRQALAEMRRLFTLLRSDAPPERAPQPTPAELEPLVAQVREAGLRVELHIDGEPVPLSEDVALCAYRIIQEALTNVLRHAGPSRHASAPVEHVSVRVVKDAPPDQLLRAVHVVSAGDL